MNINRWCIQKSISRLATSEMYKLFTLIILGVFTIEGSLGDDYNLGKCPDVDPMSHFDMQKMLGLWYAIQKTSTSSDCLMYHFAEIIPQEEYEMLEIKPHSTILPASLKHEHYTTGTLKMPDPTVPAELELDLPMDIGTWRFVVISTDYNNYAAIFTCKKMPLLHKWSAVILSRKPTLDMTYVDAIRTRLSSYNIDPFSLSIITQKKCPKPGEKGSIIKTLSNLYENTRNTVRTAVNDLTSSPDEKQQDHS